MSEQEKTQEPTPSIANQGVLNGNSGFRLMVGSPPYKLSHNEDTLLLQRMGRSLRQYPGIVVPSSLIESIQKEVDTLTEPAIQQDLPTK